MPSGTAKITANSEAMPINGKVTVAFDNNSLVMSAPVRIDDPRSPRIAFDSHEKYCAVSDL